MRPHGQWSGPCGYTLWPGYVVMHHSKWSVGSVILAPGAGQGLGPMDLGGMGLP